jgi:hypothetical protein
MGRGRVSRRMFTEIAAPRQNPHLPSVIPSSFLFLSGKKSLFVGKSGSILSFHPLNQCP